VQRRTEILELGRLVARDEGRRAGIALGKEIGLAHRPHRWIDAGDHRPAYGDARREAAGAVGDRVRILRRLLPRDRQGNALDRHPRGNGLLERLGRLLRRRCRRLRGHHAKAEHRAALLEPRLALRVVALAIGEGIGLVGVAVVAERHRLGRIAHRARIVEEHRLARRILLHAMLGVRLEAVAAGGEAQGEIIAVAKAYADRAEGAVIRLLRAAAETGHRPQDAVSLIVAVGAAEQEAAAAIRCELPLEPVDARIDRAAAAALLPEQPAAAIVAFRVGARLGELGTERFVAAASAERRKLGPEGAAETGLRCGWRRDADQDQRGSEKRRNTHGLFPKPMQFTAFAAETHPASRESYRGGTPHFAVEWGRRRDPLASAVHEEE
jgi:hypothetical protein